MNDAARATTGGSSYEPGLVSTVIPVCNRPRLVERALASVFAQTHAAVEVVLVDDASDDETPAVLARWAAAHPGRVHVVRHPERRGPGAARETGRREIRGEYVQYLDSDDELLPVKFERQIAALGAGDRACIAYGITYRTSADGTLDRTPHKATGRAVGRLFPQLLVERVWDTPTPLYTRAAIEAIGPWSDARHDEDLEYEARAGALDLPLVFVAEPVAIVHRHAEGHQGGNRGDLGRFWQDRLHSHESVVHSMLRAGVDATVPARRHYARSLFHMARWAAADGQPQASGGFMRLAARADAGVRPWSRRLYALGSRLVGRSRLARWVAARERAR